MTSIENCMNERQNCAVLSCLSFVSRELNHIAALSELMSQLFLLNLPQEKYEATAQINLTNYPWNWRSKRND